MMKSLAIAILLLMTATPCAAQEASTAVRTGAALRMLDYVALVSYMVVILVIGFYFSRREKTTTFWVAGESRGGRQR
jgi:hypothetical protein